jgi:small subunit ribosomal protein S1
MSKELIKPQQFRKAETIWNDESLQLNDEQKQELSQLYEQAAGSYKEGRLVTGKVVNITADGVLIDIGFKSDGLIPLHEFADYELKKFTPGCEIEVILDELENIEGSVILSYEKAKAARAWDIIMKLYEEGKIVEGTVTHKVKGGLSVDIGVPAFLPGSQVDVQRVTNFDDFLGQTITAYIIKVNQKRGNVIISRRKVLSEQRAEIRKKVLETLQAGNIIQGVVKNITNYGAFIDIGGVDGLLHITDMTWGRIAHPSELIKIGDTISVKILSLDPVNEKISLGLKQLQGNPWEQLDPEIAIGSKIKGIISSITDYGLFVEVAKGVEGLAHISEISWTDRIADLNKHYKVGDIIEALVVSLDKENRRMSLSIKQLDKNPWDVVAEQYTVGQRIKGPVTNVTDFGVFVQLIPGVDGLIHVSDLSWTEHVKNPADMFKKGDIIEAIITDINKQKKKVSLGIKQLAENPWDLIEQQYPIGSMIEGEVSKIADFGAFIKLSNGIEGLIHISELSENPVNKVEDVLQVGQKATFRVIKVSKEEQKLGLTLKKEAPEEPKTKKESAGDEKRAARRAKVESTQVGDKMKSQLQLELERHAARLNDKDTDSKE